MKFLVRSTLLFKAKKSPIGTIHKWHDGEYIKVGDHEWHKQKLKPLTIKALTDHGKGKDPELIADLKKQLPPAMKDYANHLIDLDHDPHHTKANDYHDFFAQVFDDPEWDKNGWQSTADLMHTVMRNYHGMLHHEGAKQLKEGKLKEGPDTSASIQFRLVEHPDFPDRAMRLEYKNSDGEWAVSRGFIMKDEAEKVKNREETETLLIASAHLMSKKKFVQEMLKVQGFSDIDSSNQIKNLAWRHKARVLDAHKKGYRISDAAKKDYPKFLSDELPPEVNDAAQKQTNMIRSVDLSKTNPEQRFRVLNLLKDTNQIMLSMGIKFKTPLHFEVKAREGKKVKKWAAQYLAQAKAVSLHSFTHDSKSLIHELGHAIDFAMHHKEGYQTRSEIDDPEMDATLRSKYQEMIKLVRSSPYYRAKYKPSFKKYINEPTEVFARGFEVYGLVKAEELIAAGKISKNYIKDFIPAPLRDTPHDPNSLLSIANPAKDEDRKYLDELKASKQKIADLMDYILKHDKIRKALVTVGLDVMKAKKGTGAPIGTKRKWADGTYVKKEDHKWHKEKLTKIAHDHLKEKKQKDPDLKKEFTAVVHDLAEYMIDHDVHPEDLPKRKQHEFWSSAIDDEGFATDPGWQKYINAAHEVVKKYYGTLRRPEEKTSPPDKKPDKKQLAKPIIKENEVMDDSAIPLQQELPPQEVNPPPQSEPEPVVAPDPEPAKKDFKPSIYQQKIFDWIKNGTGNGVIDAKAGSGKTSSIVKALEMIPRNKSVIFLAFNTSARDELNERVPQWAVDQKAVRTLNSLGFAAWARQMGGYGQLRVDGSKTATIIRNTLEFEDQPYRHVVKDLVSKAKQAGLAPKMQGIQGIVPDTADSWFNLISHFNIDVSNHDPQKAVSLARMILRKSIEEKRVIDFDDQFYMPIIHNSPWPKHDFMFVDECLPGSTNILLADGSEKSIKEIVETRSAVEVLAWDTKLRQQRVCKVTGWSKTPNVKPCVKIEVEYTKKLPAVSSIGKPYQRTAKFTRQVICTIDHKIWTENSGWVVAGRIEPGDIVQAETLAKANHKQKIGKSGRKNLSKEMSEKNRIGKCGSNKNQIPTSKQLAALKGGNGSGLTEAQSFLLSQLGPEWVAEYPVPTEIPRGQGFPTCYKIDIANPSRKIAIEIDGKSHRLLERKKQDAKKDKLLRKLGWMVLRYSNEDAVRQHEKIKKLVCVGGNCPVDGTVISVEKYDFNEAFVYDLTVDDCHNFYANGILVHNCQDVSNIQREAIKRAADSKTRVIAVGDKNQCIYGFRGANPESFDLLKKEFNAQVFDLPVSYRCAKKIIDSVKHLVPGIKARDDAPEGEVKDFGYDWSNQDFKQTDMIVCRNNAPLVSVAYKLLREKIPCKLMGRDIGSNITTLIKKWKPKNLKDLREEATRWSRNEIRIATARDPDADLTSIEDRYETIITFLEETKADTVAGLVAEIEAMFAEDKGAKSENILRLSTVHKAKGLEAPRVWILNRELMPHKMAKLAWQKQQEDNLIYVAHTRAKQSLYFIQKDMPQGLKKAIDAMLGQEEFE